MIVSIVTISVALRYGEEHTAYDDFVSYLFVPAVWLANSLHLLGDAILGFWAVTAAALVIYALMTWLALSILSRARTGRF